jgi:hypothetical protein
LSSYACNDHYFKHLTINFEVPTITQIILHLIFHCPFDTKRTTLSYQHVQQMRHNGVKLMEYMGGKLYMVTM